MTSALTRLSSLCFFATVPETENRASPLLLKLQRNRVINTLVKRLGLHRLADVALRFRPLRKKTPKGFEYHIRSVASLVAANEIFETEMYRKPLQGEPIRSFVDLGCNVGYFPILLADLTESTQLKGLILDGNDAVLNEAKTHLRHNGLNSVDPVLGLAGFSDDQKSADFLVNPGSHIASTATGKQNPDVPLAGRTIKVRVPCINVEAAWENRYGAARIDILKVDIEGMELELFRNSPALLARTDRILYEWHKWQVSAEDCEAVLMAAGFEKPETVWEDAQHGLAYCRRRSGKL